MCSFACSSSQLAPRTIRGSQESTLDAIARKHLNRLRAARNGRAVM
jgi:hypothetical protein